MVHLEYCTYKKKNDKKPIKLTYNKRSYIHIATGAAASNSCIILHTICDTWVVGVHRKPRSKFSGNG